MFYGAIYDDDSQKKTFPTDSLLFHRTLCVWSGDMPFGGIVHLIVVLLSPLWRTVVSSCVAAAIRCYFSLLVCLFLQDEEQPATIGNAETPNTILSASVCNTNGILEYAALTVVYTLWHLPHLEFAGLLFFWILLSLWDFKSIAYLLNARMLQCLEWLASLREIHLTLMLLASQRRKYIFS